MTETYTNPVYADNFPDPFVLKWCGAYYAYCTGPWHDGRVFGVLRSHDLVHWEELGGAMEPLPGNLPHYWAPELAMFGGRFFLYYSAGDELSDMAVRVAVADHPAGPFVDQGLRLTTEPFAIDAHVFVDDDGARYLFYATDYLEHSFVGTGTAMARMANPWSLAGPSQPVTRARFDWQVYDPNRAEKGGVRWHTVEGPFVLKRKGRYYQMFSGGNWQNPSYGVSYATSDRVERPDEWEQHADGNLLLPILRTVPGRVIGPGHNSVVRGPDNRQLMCVYHRWIGEGRAMAVDPLDWAGERMLVLGPSDAPQPAPGGPSVADHFSAEHDDGLGAAWEISGGTWRTHGGAALQLAAVEPAAARSTHRAPRFLAEVSAYANSEAPDAPPGAGTYGISLEGEAGTLAYVLVAPGLGQAKVLWHAESGWLEDHIPLPAGFDAGRFELIRAEVDGPQVRVTIGEGRPQWQGRCAAGPTHVALRTSGRAAAFAGFAVTDGFENLFDEPAAPEDLGWRPLGGAWSVAEGELRCEPAGESAALKGGLPAAYELVVNARCAAPASDRAYGILPAASAAGGGPLLAVEREGEGWVAVWRDEAGVERRHGLPGRFDPQAHQQWRIAVSGGAAHVAWEDHLVGTFPAPAGEAVGLVALGAPAAFEMVRVTAR